LMTILGPCRALSPYGADAADVSGPRTSP
jgi:hypothetical protein